MINKLFIRSIFSTCFAATFIVNASHVNDKDGKYDLMPTGKGSSFFSDKAPARNVTIPQNGIYYHGGPVMGTTNVNTPNVYIIWYGNWANNTATTLLPNLLSGIGASSYFRINTTYENSVGHPVISKVNFPSNNEYHDNYSLGTQLNDASVFKIVKNAIKGNKLPADHYGVYFVLTSTDVNETSGFCTTYCGWHNHGSVENIPIKYAFVGNADRCPTACSGQSNSSPNDNVGADAMANVIAHELEETVTDPYINAWYDGNGQENADKCAWTFGTTQTASNGSLYNMTINNKQYLIQQNWVNANNGYCALSY
jgi:hypothetical protein